MSIHNGDHRGTTVTSQWHCSENSTPPQAAPDSRKVKRYSRKATDSETETKRVGFVYSRFCSKKVLAISRFANFATGCPSSKTVSMAPAGLALEGETTRVATQGIQQRVKHCLRQKWPFPSTNGALCVALLLPVAIRASTIDSCLGEHLAPVVSMDHDWGNAQRRRAFQV